MFEETNELNISDITSKKEYYLNENKRYYNTTIKKKKLVKSATINNQNLLLDNLKDFSVKYEMEQKLISKDIKFVITFDELISLIRFSLESQIKINEHSKDESDYLKTLSKDFINNLSYYIFSYEKVEKMQRPISKNKNESYSNKENININGNTKRKKKSLCSIISKSPSYWAEEQKPKTNNKNKITHKEKSNLNSRTNKYKTNNIENTNSYRKNVVHKIFSPKNDTRFKNKFAKKENKIKHALNRSVVKRYSTVLSESSNNNKRKKLNKSDEKRKSGIIDKNKKTMNKNLSIFTACENLKSSSFILKNKNRSFFSTEHYDKNDKKNNNNYNSNSNININKKFKKNYNSNSNSNSNSYLNMSKKSNKKIVYYDHNLNLNVKKQIIMGNVFKPSTFANKLLQNGMKYITEFNGIKEEERKKQFY